MTSAPSQARATESGPAHNALAITLAGYAVTLASMATVGVIVPQMAQMTRHLHATVAELGWAIGLFSLPAALFSIGLGGLVDRVGAKYAILLAAFIGLGGDVAILESHSVLALQIGMAIAGIANALLIAAVPALLAAALNGREQVRAMSLWSTYGPAGYALGLLLGAPFAQGGQWRLAMLALILVLLAATALCAIILPNAPRNASENRISLRALTTLFGDAALLRISATYAAIAAVSYGSSLAAPGYLARVYGVSIASSSMAIAAAKIAATLLGGAGMGWLLARGTHRQAMFAIVCLIGLAAQFLLYFPSSGMLIATGAMILWLFVFGAISATSFVALAQFNREPARLGLAFGLIGQISSIGCFFAPSVYFSLDRWPALVVVAAVGLALAVLLLPRGRQHEYGN